jgi:hypothetical protein
MDKNLNENFEVLEELLRKTYDLISPMTHHDDLKRLTPQMMDDDSEKNPGCYLRMGNTVFPICNRIGIKSPQMMQFSLKLANKMNGVGGVDQEQLSAMIAKLNFLLSKYSQPVPRPLKAAARKGHSVKKFRRNMR